MKNLNTLIDQTFSYALTADGDLKNLYMDDMNEFISIKNALAFNENDHVKLLLDEMDTDPLEAVIVAMAADGVDINKYGYSLN